MIKNIAHENNSNEIPDIYGKVLELLNQDNSNCELMSIATILLDPGKSSTLHYHKKMEEIYYIVEGKAEIRIEDEVQNMHSGYAILIPIGALHQIKNTGANTLKFISIDSPPFIEDDTYFS